VLNDAVKDGLQAVIDRTVLPTGPTVPGSAVNHGEIQSLIFRVQFHQRVERLIHRSLKARLRPINLVYHDDGLEVRRQGFFQDKTPLWHRSTERVDQEKHAVGGAGPPLAGSSGWRWWMGSGAGG